MFATNHQTIWTLWGWIWEVLEGPHGPGALNIVLIWYACGMYMRGMRMVSVCMWIWFGVWYKFGCIRYLCVWYVDGRYMFSNGAQESPKIIQNVACRRPPNQQQTLLMPRMITKFSHKHIRVRHSALVAAASKLEIASFRLFCWHCLLACFCRFLLVLEVCLERGWEKLAEHNAAESRPI